MSAKKNVLFPFQIFTNVVLSADRTSLVTSIQNFDNVSISLHFTGGVGVFTVEGSLDYSQDINGNVVNPGNWVTVPLPTAAVAAGAGDILIDMNQLSFMYIRVKYTFGSSTGVLNGYIGGKSV